ncbi:MAG: hypoxanthine phosphoribosyltransferase [Planctomycetales bacterium]|nr:hypoxanthine phosphoribosyltransferase [Planctomycetales bacterium]
MKVLLDEKQLADGVRRMAADMSAHYGDEPVTIIGALHGCIVLLADLIRQLKMPLRVGLARANSYRGATRSPGAVTIDLDMLPDIRGRHVLLLDDIFDTGHTMVELLNQIGDLGPSSVRSAVLLRKQGRQQVDIRPDFFAFDIPDAFVVGYGLDFNNLYRNLPYIAVLEPHETAEVSSA